MYDIDKFEPLRVRATLRTQVVSDQYLPLDAVLYYHAVRREFGEQDVSIPGRGVEVEYGKIVLPLLKKNVKQRDWYYCASFAQWPAETREATQHYAKRFDGQHSDLVNFQGKVGRVLTERGQFKNLFNKLYYRHALHVDWYVNGDRAELEALLRFCTHLGKKTSQGWGRVIRWEVEPMADDWSCKLPDGNLARALPLQNNKTGVLYGVRPSYWLPKHQFQCVMP